jgi:hypothetical protein
MIPDQLARRRSRLRWYLGLGGLLGSPAALIMATEAEFAWGYRALGLAGLPLCVAYLGLAFALPRLSGRHRLVISVLSLAFLWILVLAGLTLTGPDPMLLVPIVFFLAIPCANAAMWAEEVLGPS